MYGVPGFDDDDDDDFRESDPADPPSPPLLELPRNPQTMAKRTRTRLRESQLFLTERGRKIWEVRLRKGGTAKMTKATEAARKSRRRSADESRRLRRGPPEGWSQKGGVSAPSSSMAVADLVSLLVGIGFSGNLFESFSAPCFGLIKRRGQKESLVYTCVGN